MGMIYNRKTIPNLAKDSIIPIRAKKFMCSCALTTAEYGIAQILTRKANKENGKEGLD